MTERSFRLFVLSLLMLVPIFVGTGFIGEEGPLEQVSALDPNSNVEERPGTILYSDWGPYNVWSSDKRRNNQNLSVRSQLLSADVDMDGDISPSTRPASCKASSPANDNVYPHPDRNTDP